MIYIKAKIHFLVLPILFLGFQSCQHAVVDDTANYRKVNSDLFPSKINRAQYYFDLAMAYRSEQQNPQAVESFRLALLHDPSFGRAQFELATTYVRMENYTLASVEIDRFLQLQDPSVDEVAFITKLFIKAGSYDKAIQLQQTAYDLYKQNSFMWAKFSLQMEISYFEQADQTLDTLEANQENIYLVGMARAENKIQQQKPHEALAALEMADKDKPHQEMNLRLRAHLLNQVGDYEQSIVITKRYIRYHPFNANVSRSLTIAALQTGKYDLALDELAVQKQISPWDFTIDYQMAYMYFLKKEYSKAEEIYKDLHLLTESEQSLYFLAQIQILQDNYQGANKLIKMMSTNSDFYPVVQIQLARLDWKNNRKGKAMQRMHESHLARPDSVEIYREYVQYMIWENRFVESMALIEKAREFFQEDVQLAMLAASIHYLMEYPKGFQKEIDYVLNKEPNNPDVYLMMAELWYKMKKPAAEIELLAKKAEALNSTHPNIRPLLAWALLKQDKLTEAVQIFENLYDENPQELFFAQALAEIYAKNHLRAKTRDMVNRAIDIKLTGQFNVRNTYFEGANQTANVNSLVINTSQPEVLIRKQVEGTHLDQSQRRLPASQNNSESPEKK